MSGPNSEPDLQANNWARAVAADQQSFDPADVFAAVMHNHHIANTSYPMAHNQTRGPYRIKRAAMAEIQQAAFARIQDMCLYVHIPFCEKRCYYCEYTVVAKRELDQTRAYCDLLLQEMRYYADLLQTSCCMAATSVAVRQPSRRQI